LREGENHHRPGPRSHIHQKGLDLKVFDVPLTFSAAMDSPGRETVQLRPEDSKPFSRFRHGKISRYILFCLVTPFFERETGFQR
jgi:hypothetical protein